MKSPSLMRRRHNELVSSAVRILKGLEDGLIKKEDLTSHQRKVVVKFYLEELSHTSNRAIAEKIGISDMQVGRIKKFLLRHSVWEIEDVDVKMVAVTLSKKKEEYQRKAAKDGDTALAWRIECDFVEKLAALGFIKLQPARVLVGHVDLENLQGQLKEFFVEHQLYLLIYGILKRVGDLFGSLLNQ